MSTCPRRNRSPQTLQVLHSRRVLVVFDRLPGRFVKRPAAKQRDTCADVKPVTRRWLVNAVAVWVHAALHFVEAHLLAKQIAQLGERREVNGLQESDFPIAYALYNEALHLSQLFIAKLGKCGDAWFCAVISFLRSGKTLI